MALKKFNPTTPGQRQLVMVDRSSLYKGKPVKALTEGKQSNGGRNNTGRITVRFRGGGHKKAYRTVDFKRNKIDVAAVVERLEYDPNRTAFIALIKYADGEQAYILAPQRLAAGDTVVAGNYVDVKPGNVMPLGNMPIGTIGQNVERKIGKGRPAGALRRHLRPDRRPRPGLRDRAPELGRAAPGARPLPRHHRRGLQPRSHEHLDRQGRPYPLARLAGAQPGRRHVPHRPSA